MVDGINEEWAAFYLELPRQLQRNIPEITTAGRVIPSSDLAGSFDMFLRIGSSRNYIIYTWGISH